MAGFTGANGASYTTAANAAASINIANASAAIAKPAATPAPVAAPIAPKPPATPTSAVSAANSTVTQPVANPTAQAAINTSRQTQGAATGTPQTQNQLLNAGANTSGANQGAATTVAATASNLQPWQKSDYSTNLSYVPTDTTDPVFSQITDPYTLAILTANMTNASGKTNIDTSKMPTSAEDETEQTVQQNQQKQTYMDSQIDTSIQNSRAATAQSQSAVNATIGNVNREGATSTGNAQTAQQIVQKYGSDQANLEAQYNQQKLELQQATDSGDQNAIKSLSENVAATQQQLLTTANAQLTDAKNLVDSLSKSGGLTGATDDSLMQLSDQSGISFPILKAMATQANVAAQSQTQKDKATATASAIDSFVKLNAAGVPLTPDMVQSTATAMGVDPTMLQGAAAGFNQTVQSIQADKTLDAATKQTALDKAKQDLQDQMNGLSGKAGQDIKGLENLYRTGASQDVISAYKQAAGITDYNDPATALKLQADQLDYTIKQAEANGQAPTIADQVQLADLQAKQADLGLPVTGMPNGTAPDNLIPTNSLNGIQGSVTNGKLVISCPADQTQLQCGAGVNRFWGLAAGAGGGMPSSYTGKQALVDSNGVTSESLIASGDYSQIKPGMAFVMPETGSFAANGHTGIVTQNLGNGQFTYQAWDNTGTAKSKADFGGGTMSVKQVYGFANPPANSFTPTSGTGQSTTIGLAQITNISIGDLTKGLTDGTIDINKLSTSAFAHVKEVLGPDTLKSIQDTASSSPQALVKSGQMTQASLDIAAKSILDGKASPDQYGRMGPQILARAQQLDTSGTFDPKQVTADWEAVKGNAAAYAKVEASAKSASTLFGTLQQQQADAFKALAQTPQAQAAGSMLGSAAIGPARAIAENYGFTGFKTPEATLADLKGQIASVAASGTSPHDETLKTLGSSLSLNQTPDQFAASLQGIKQAMDAKTAELEASQAPGKTYGTYEGQGGAGGTSTAGLGSKIQQAVSAGHSSQDIIDYLSKDATYGTQVQAALSHGYSADEIIAYLNKQ